jgi:hypothetical protein
MIAKRNGSGIQRWTSFTEPLISFWNKGIRVERVERVKRVEKVKRG